MFGVGVEVTGGVTRVGVSVFVSLAVDVGVAGV